jgi:hypothetical protein
MILCRHTLHAFNELVAPVLHGPTPVALATRIDARRQHVNGWFFLQR